ncbi:T6SS immunity protein Tdi1 domain-containing protein [Listeria booriae]|uniref:T6SS immunity protein Tdi1 domain-containing protein n=1 Tax=Listeria booriae TaxID=1552123 RepID=UPI0016233EC0|nr:T6SS immunity protein Tdi1 domain-containing protein [Listeria booriae]MBC2168887.1 DUF1851 domain-containing protein [Listeria booriae]
MSVLQDFQLIEKVPANVLQEYQDKVPEEVIQFWKEYGFGTFMGGYFKSVNPMEYKEILESTSEGFTDGIVLFATGMGDLLIWIEGYVCLMNYRYGIIKTILFSFKFFFANVEDDGYREEDLMWNPYQEAVKKLGIPAYDECFGYVPILALGGPEKVDNLQKVKLKEHILLISALAGAIQ